MSEKVDDQAKAEEQDGDFLSKLRRRAAENGNSPTIDPQKLLPMPEPLRNRLNSIRQKTWTYRCVQIVFLLVALRWCGNLFELLGAEGRVSAYLTGFVAVLFKVIVGFTALSLIRRGIVAINIGRVNRASDLAHRDVAAGKVPRNLDRIEELAYMILHITGAICGTLVAVVIYAAQVDHLHIPILIGVSIVGLLAGVVVTLWMRFCSFTYEAMIYARKNVRNLAELMKQGTTRDVPIWRKYQQMPKEYIIVPTRKDT
ncbi:hypothetical protein JIN84_09030 [Luteolibacter yonseiensis]|uniref:Uncharacterized protein n=1 Tax=Luteolibacter yonseiensis TaxID=1144680 RepID=A0A934R2P8_9BACT|nr:hypothetical protein [Luteolibacter yonseiensis]MBK1815759.1 hypothetical protein [Luteolibacter yonseiensis]